MKHLNYLVCAALATAAAAACDNEPEIVDFPIVGDLTLYGSSAQGAWAEGDEIGIFVTSDGVAQSNLAYVPASFDVEESVALNAKGEKAGFKQGEHMIYAYYPYSAEVTDYTKIPVDYTVQETYEYDPYAGTDYAGMMTQAKTKTAPFAVAKTSVSEYSSVAVSLDFASDATLYSIEGGISFQPTDDVVVGKKVKKVVISCDKTMAYKNATYDLTTGEITGEPVNSIEIAMDAVLAKTYFISASAFEFVSVLSEDDAHATTFKVEITLDDNSIYVNEEYKCNSFTYDMDEDGVEELIYTWPAIEFSATPAEE